MLSELAGFDLEAAAASGQTTVAVDAARAQKASAWLAKRFRDRLAKDPDVATDTARAVRHAAVKQAADLQSSVSYETATAFNEERRIVAGSAYRTPARPTEPVSYVELVKLWDAVLDRHTCGVCSDADGTIVGLHDEFPQGSPGAVHGRCRCIEIIVPRELRLEFREAA